MRLGAGTGGRRTASPQATATAPASVDHHPPGLEDTSLSQGRLGGSEHRTSTRPTWGEGGTNVGDNLQSTKYNLRLISKVNDDMGFCLHLLNPDIAFYIVYA